ncbi:MAG: hypothetical protein JJ975_06360 [Bacteroidia bacterium]|nr:hypothetical protein [Bacteroidia bacterium]
MTTEILEIRPRFRKLSPEQMDWLLARLQELINEETDQIKGEIVGHHATIRIPEEQRHFWSPQLSLNFEQRQDGTQIRGLYGPRPDVWLMFMFVYFLLGFAALVLLIVGLSRYNLGLSSYFLWIVPFILGGIVTLWLGGKAGKKIGHSQIYQIHNLIKPNLLTNAVDIDDW